MTDLIAERRVQFVSKPIVPPYRDGTKCLVRDLCRNYQRVVPEVMGTSDGAPGLGERTVVHPVYPADGAYAPGLTQNMRAAFWLAFHCRADIWHYVFAPNPRSSQVGRALHRLRGVPAVQTIASPPRDFSDPEKLLFADVLVAQSNWTREQFEKAFEERGAAAPPIEVVFPPCPSVAVPSEEAKSKARAAIGVSPEVPLYVYPGDLEFSGGADFALEFGGRMATQVPEAVTLLAYRGKTQRADERAAQLAGRIDSSSVRLTKDVEDIHALLAAATAVIFPVDDLYGKVDLPIVLLESLTLGVPVLALDAGPLRDLAGAQRLPGDVELWVGAAERLVRDADFRDAQRASGRDAVSSVFAADAVAARYEELYGRLLHRGLKS